MSVIDKCKKGMCGIDTCQISGIGISKSEVWNRNILQDMCGTYTCRMRCLEEIHVKWKVCNRYM